MSSQVAVITVFDGWIDRKPEKSQFHVLLENVMLYVVPF